MDLSVVVVTYNSERFIGRCLASVEAYVSGLGYDLCVVDNASIDGTAQLVRREFPFARLIANTENRGFAAAVNQGLRATSGRYAMWLNPDAELLDGGFKEIIRYLDEHPEVGVLGPRIIDPDGSLQFSCRSFPTYRTALFHRYALLTSWFPANKFSTQYLLTDLDRARLADVDWVSGACLVHRRDVIDRVGPLDEAFFMYCEDVDFCFRVRRAGLAVRYHPGAQILHHVGGSSRTSAYRPILDRHRSMWRYYSKHFDRRWFTDAAVASGIAGRCGLLLARAFMRQLARGRVVRPSVTRAGVEGRSP